MIDILPARLGNILVVYESGFILGIFVKDSWTSAALWRKLCGSSEREAGEGALREVLRELSEGGWRGSPEGSPERKL